MKNLLMRVAIAVGSIACVATAASVVMIGLSGKSMRMTWITSAGQVLVEINTEASASPVCLDQDEQGVLIASSVVP